MKLQVIENPTAEQMDFFEKRIEEFNIERWEVKKKIPIVIEVKNESGEIIAGVAAKTFGNWLLIDNLWVHETQRGNDLGTTILNQLEESAKSRGCIYALLDTLNFQARPFYERFGYRVAWTQENYPRVGCKHFMIKNLV